MSRAVSAALIALVLASNLVGGIAFWCHNDGEAHDEPCCGQSADADQPAQLADASCCEELSQWRLTQAVERVELSVTARQMVAVVSIVEPPVFAAPSFVVESREPPRPGGGGLLQLHRSLLI